MAASEAEHGCWLNLLTPYAWAEGEVGLLCTEAGFSKFCADSRANPDIALELKREAHAVGILLQTGHYVDVCLETGEIARR